MFDPLTLALIGGAAGGLLNRRDPMKGALMGAGIGAAGGALAPQMFVPEAAMTTGTGIAPSIAESATPAVGLKAGGGMGLTGSMAMPYGITATGTPAQVAAQSPGLLGGMREVAGVMKPIGEAAGAANSVAGLLGAKGSAQPPIVASPFMQQGNGPGTMTQLANSMQQTNELRKQQDMQRRMRSRQLIGGVGYGGLA